MALKKYLLIVIRSSKPGVFCQSAHCPERLYIITLIYKHNRRRFCYYVELRHRIASEQFSVSADIIQACCRLEIYFNSHELYNQNVRTAYALPQTTERLFFCRHQGRIQRRQSVYSVRCRLKVPPKFPAVEIYASFHSLE